MSERTEGAARVKEKMRDSYSWFFESLATIVNKQGEAITPELNAGQRQLIEIIERQEAADEPVRVIILKARQLGFSTLVQSMILQRCLMRPFHEACILAHDRATGGRLFGMAARIYGGLPEGIGVKPEILGRQRAKSMHFSNGGVDAINRGDAWPDSTYMVDTAGEFESGRGATFHSVHASELAFWGQVSTKLTALRAAVPEEPGTMFVIESTANGFNDFSEIWEQAVSGDSAYAPLFCPWFIETSYSRPFMDEAERKEFRPGTGRYGEGEKKLIDDFGLSLEQLNWRRHTIANQCGGKIDTYRQEFPSTPAEAFISTDTTVFDAFAVQGILVETELTDPATARDLEGPHRGTFEAREYVSRRGRGGQELEVPEGVLWRPRQELAEGLDAPWKLWPAGADRTEVVKPNGHYIVGVDVSGQETEDASATASWHAISIVDHESRVQVAEYKSHADLTLLTEQIYLAAVFFNDAWVAVEVTGGYGRPVVRRLWLDLRYPYLYFRKSPDGKSQRKESRVGWDTNARTRPELVAKVEDLVRSDDHGIKSRGLAMEMSTFVRLKSGKTRHSAGRHDDLLFAFAIAQMCCDLLVVRRASRSISRDPAPRGIGVRSR